MRLISSFFLGVTTFCTVALVRPDYLPNGEALQSHLPEGVLGVLPDSLDARAVWTGLVAHLPADSSSQRADFTWMADTLASYVVLPDGFALAPEAPARPLGGFLLPGATDVQLAGARAAFDAHLATRESGFLAIPHLSRADKRELRRSRNDRHLEHARRLGVEPGLNRAALVAEGALVEMPDTTDHYIIRKNAALLTPDAVAAVELIQERFAAALAERGLPPFRVTVSSTYRSAKDQAALRRRNRNATRGTSSHEFGTTFDLAYRRYAPAAASAAGIETYAMPEGLPARERAWLATEFAQRERAWAREVARRYPNQLLALLGRVLVELEDEGQVVVVGEWRQPCFHVTVARRLVAPRA